MVTALHVHPPPPSASVILKEEATAQTSVLATSLLETTAVSILSHRKLPACRAAQLLSPTYSSLRQHPPQPPTPTHDFHLQASSIRHLITRASKVLEVGHTPLVATFMCKHCRQPVALLMNNGRQRRRETPSLAHILILLSERTLY